MTEEAKTENDTVKASKKKAIKTLMLGALSKERCPGFSQTALYATADGVKKRVIRWHRVNSTSELPYYTNSPDPDAPPEYPKEISVHFRVYKGNVDTNTVRFVSDIGGEEYVYDLDDVTLTGAVEAEINGQKVTHVPFDTPKTIPPLYIPGSKDEVIERISQFSESDDAILDIRQETQAILDKGVEAKTKATKELEEVSREMSTQRILRSEDPWLQEVVTKMGKEMSQKMDEAHGEEGKALKKPKTIVGRMQSIFGGKATKSAANDIESTSASFGLPQFQYISGPRDRRK